MKTLTILAALALTPILTPTPPSVSAAIGTSSYQLTLGSSILSNNWH